MTYRYLLFPVLVRLALATGDATTAAAAAQAAAREAERESLPVKTAAADSCRGLLDGDSGALLAAAVYYKSALRPLEWAQALADAAAPSRATSHTSWASSARDHGSRSSARPSSTRQPGNTPRPADGKNPAWGLGPDRPALSGRRAGAHYRDLVRAAIGYFLGTRQAA